MANSFDCKQVDDCIYYLLYVWKQLDYNQERDELHLVGFFNDKEKLNSGLKQFVRQVFIINPKSEFTRQGVAKLEDIPYDLQTLTLCEL